MSVFMGTNIMFWSSQGVRSKRNELELYLREDDFDIVALNETFLTKKIDFKVQGYDAIKNDRSTGVRSGVAFLVKHGLVINKECCNTDFNIITDNEALVIDIDLSNNQNLILATIYCPNGNPNLRLFETINNLSDNVMFVDDFNPKLEAFGCAKKNTSGPMPKTIQNQLNLIYLNTDEHMHLDTYTGNTDILDMAFISPNLSKHDIQFLIGDDLGSDHPSKWQYILNLIGTYTLTPLGINLTRPTEKCLNQPSRWHLGQEMFLSLSLPRILISMQTLLLLLLSALQ